MRKITRVVDCRAADHPRPAVQVEQDGQVFIVGANVDFVGQAAQFELEFLIHLDHTFYWKHQCGMSIAFFIIIKLV